MAARALSVTPMVLKRLPDLAQSLCMVLTCLALVFSALGSVAQATEQPALTSTEHAHHDASASVMGHAHHAAHAGMDCCDTDMPQDDACHATACCAFVAGTTFAPRGATPVITAPLVRFAELQVTQYAGTLPERPPRTI